MIKMNKTECKKWINTTFKDLPKIETEKSTFQAIPLWLRKDSKLTSDDIKEIRKVWNENKETLKELNLAIYGKEYNGKDYFTLYRFL